MLEKISSFIIDNCISLTALFVSFVSLFLSLKQYRLSIPRLNFHIADDFSRYIGFIWYEPYNLAILKLYISNPSSQAVTIDSITLKYHGEKYLADTCSINDRYNENGITLLYKDDPKYLTKINISSENILNTKRIDAYGTSIGFAVFYDFPPIFRSVDCTLTLSLPNGKYCSQSVLIHPLNENQRPVNPLDKK